MPKFEYKAKDQRGTLLTGELVAASYLDAWEALLKKDLEPVALVAQSSMIDKEHSARPQFEPVRLNESESVEVLEQVSDLSTANLPLIAGLRAAAAQAQRPRVRKTLTNIALGLEEGQSLETTVSKIESGLPRYVQGLTVAAARSGKLGIALEELLSHSRTVQNIRRTLVASIAYPVLVFLLALAIFAMLFSWVVPEFKIMFEEFGIELPPSTIAMIRVSDAWIMSTTGIWRIYTLGFVVGTLAGILLLRVAVGEARWRRFVGTLPLIGPLWTWSGAASFAKLLAILLEQGLPLPEALTLTSSGVRDRNVSQTCLELAAGVSSGARLSELLLKNRRLPDSMIPFLEVGEENGNLPEALEVVSDLFLGRMRMRATVLRAVSPPVLFICVALAVVLCLAGLTIPLFSLLSGLA